MKPKILIVDDEPLNLTTLEAFLSGDGYELHFAANGRDGCAKAHVIQPDLILLDVMMPEMDGFAVCRHIRADPVIGRIPIIVVTALDDDRSRLEGLRAGADDFLTKPCRREEIRARVRTVASLNRFRAIAEQSERFQRLYDLSPAAIVLADEQGKVVAANRLAHTMLGADGRAIEGDSLSARFDATGAKIVRTAIDTALRGGVATSRELRRGSGETEIVMQVRATAIPDSGARLAMLVFDNVTEEVKARLALENINRELDVMVRARTRQLEEANALLMSYASFVSHDLRSPLTVMKGYLSLLHEGMVPVNAEAAPAIEHAYNASVVMQELVQNILQLAQDVHDGTGSSAVGLVEPRPIIARLFQHLNSLFPNPARRFTLDPLPEVGVSAVVIERVFYNLIGNALKYSAARAVPEIAIGFMAGKPGEGPVLFVRDNGVGFDSRQADKLFREFSRLDTAEKSDGFGLGLSLVARLVRMHGGNIWAEAAIDAGATFYVQFPLPAEAPPPALEG
jgi:hypothetical protein